MMFESHFKLTLWEWRTLRMRLKNPLFFQITPSIQWITLFKIRILKLFLWLLHSKTSVEEQKKPHLVQPAFLQLTRNKNVSYLNNNSNYISTSTTLELWHKVLLSTHWALICLSLCLLPSVALSLEAKLQMLHSYMTVTWLPLPCEVKIKVHTSTLSHVCSSAAGRFRKPYFRQQDPLGHPGFAQTAFVFTGKMNHWLKKEQLWFIFELTNEGWLSLPTK